MGDGRGRSLLLARITFSMKNEGMWLEEGPGVPQRGEGCRREGLEKYTDSLHEPASVSRKRSRKQSTWFMAFLAADEMRISMAAVAGMTSGGSEGIACISVGLGLLRVPRAAFARSRAGRARLRS